MSISVPPVNATELIQPLLTSLLSASLSAYPPALLPYLSPILRQRVKMLCDGTGPWLPLLSYQEESGKKLLETVTKSEMLEPHPVSGEVELDVDLKEVGQKYTSYARMDEETLVARIEIEELGMEVRGTWCLNDAEGGGSGWRISEVGAIGSSFKGEISHASWSSTVSGAESMWKSSSAPKPEEEKEEEDDDAAYWAQYDNEASSTPAPAAQPSPAPPMGLGQSGDAEEDYYNRYGSVQPAMDGHDPDEAVEGVDSGLGSHHVAAYNRSPQAQVDGATSHIIQPRPHSSSHSSTSSGARSAVVSALEEKAEADSIQHSPVVVSPMHLSPSSQPSVDRDTQSEMAIRQHISTSLKSMYRLARATGMDREAFRELVETEAQLCGVEEDDL